MSGFFDDATLNIPCQKCGHHMPETVARLKNDPQLTCPRCGTVTKVEASQLREGLDAADQALDDFRRSIEKLGKG